MEIVKISEIENLLKDDFYKNKIEDESKFIDSLEKYFSDRKEKKAVLGMDIYKYSKYPPLQQDLIPFILKKIYKSAFSEYRNNEDYVAELYPDLENNFLDTGDGGYFLFDNPLDALIFSLYLNAAVHLYNSSIIYPNLRRQIGSLTVRFSITFDKLFQLEKNFYGPAIINNARIMSKDKLNRMLIDKSSYDWFLQEINGIENIRYFAQMRDTRKERNKTVLGEEKESDFFKKYDGSFFLNIHKNDPTPKVIHLFEIFNSVVCQKLDKINVKNDEFDIYNLFIQYWCTMANNDEVSITDEKYYKESLTLSLGNLNTNGI